MNNNTTIKLNNLATKISSSLILAQKSGCLAKSPNHDDTKKFEELKKTISVCKDWFGIHPNILKTTQQYNYLVNEVQHRLQTKGFFSAESMKNVSTVDYSKPTQLVFEFN